MDMKNNIDVIVVGAGPSGVACAICVAKKGNRVLVVEKSSEYGVKNMFGGAIYLESVKELLPDSYENLPVERFLTKHNYVIFNEENSLNVSYTNNENKTSATITRHDFDTFLVNEAKKLGVYFAPNTLVVDVIKKDNRVVGIKTENEEIYSKIVVIAEGFNTILSEKIGLKKKIEPKSAILGVKEVIKLPTKTIEGKFNLKNKEGALFEFFGGLHKENENIPLGMGFLYTNKNSVSIGVGISMESLKQEKIKPYEYLNRLKDNEFVKSLIEGGEVVEYSAHSIPEGGYNELPKLFDNGVILVGDAANLVDSIHFEGTNLAIKSGILAGETCNLAISKKDYSKKTLKNYKKELFNSFVIQDLKTYKDIFKTLLNRKKSIFSYYPKKIDEFFEMWITADNKGKKKNYKKFFLSFFKERPLKELIADVISFVKCAFGAII